MLLKIETPVRTDLSNVLVGSRVEIHGVVYTARDAILPKIAKMIKDGTITELPITMEGAAFMHAAFSPAGFGPTSSNKEEIEGTMGILSEAGVRLHIGKGVLKKQTVKDISRHGAIFIVVPPTSALFQSRLISKRVIAFEEEGMEALHELTIRGLPGIIAAANGESIFHVK